MKKLTKMNAQRMRCLLGVTLLLLVHCAGSTLAMTEHHRCIYDYVNVLVKDKKVLFSGSPSSTHNAIMAETSGEVEAAEGMATNNGVPVPSIPSFPRVGRKPIRIKVFMVDPIRGSNCTKEDDKYLNVFGKHKKCTAKDIMTPEKQNILEHTIIHEAVKLHADRLAVDPLKSPIVVPRYSDTTVCGRFNIPEEHHTKGIEGIDMVLYATAAPAVDGAFAWAATCAVHPNGRPLIGVINYSPRHIARTSQAVRVAAHEIAHTLGFNVETMHKQAKMVGISIKEARGKEVFVFDAAKTKVWAKYHYQCKRFYGMEMEDDTVWTSDEVSAEWPQHGELDLRSAVPLGIQAEEAAASQMSKKRRRNLADWELYTMLGVSSHWKRRNAKDELMAGFVGAGRYTAITLSAFEDMEYYSVDYSKAEPMRWGRGAGCDFLNKTCVTNGVSNNVAMFCDSSYDDKLRCTSDRQALGTCVIQTYEEIPDAYKYFNAEGGKILGGRREDMMDYCPIIVADKGFSCIDGNRSKMPGSLVGANSRCVRGNDLTVLGEAVGDVCVHVACFEGSVYVQYAGAPTYYLCPQGKFLKVHGDFAKGGSIACPRYEDVCTAMLPEAESSTASGVSSLSKLGADMSTLRINTAVDRHIIDPTAAEPEGGKPQTAPATQGTEVTVVSSADTSDREVTSATTSSEAPVGQTVTDATKERSSTASGTEDGQTSTSAVTGDTETPVVSKLSAGTTHATNGDSRQRIVTAHGRNLDLKLNADGSAAASALMPLVLAVLVASAIMAH
ncbi:putative surface protease GP63 [Trypanosoma grayi]|uniref:putative surface protease GP63 n=1 Tax=Trypanosoma grayi TaxID=71804 RepID=UPI0004F44E5D|nr:putative surface protease GP63 [Trypanosoma grayi]KEG07354.1 putative surface protease GP63 [Trypanosoma grayi]